MSPSAQNKTKNRVIRAIRAKNFGWYIWLRHFDLSHATPSVPSQ